MQDYSPYFDVNLSVQLVSDLTVLRATWGKWKKAFNEHLLSSRLHAGCILLKSRLLAYSGRKMQESFQMKNIELDGNDPNTILKNT